MRKYLGRAEFCVILRRSEMKSNTDQYELGNLYQQIFGKVALEGFSA